MANSERNKPLVLLFYDGFERSALAGHVGGTYAQGRRAARFLYRTLQRRQVRTGFYTAFISLVRCLKQADCEVRINDFKAAQARPDYPIGLAGYPSVLDRVKLPNPVIFGPGDFGAPEAARAIAANDRFRLLIQPCDWFVDYYRPYCGDKLMPWFAGIDLDLWPDESKHPKTIDFLIYDKIRWMRDERVPAVLHRVQRALTKRGLTQRTLQYAAHHQSEFRRELRRSRALIFLCEHETQGLAYQEALAVGAPVLAWDEGELIDPFLRQFARPDLVVSSVPYFDGRCGRRFTLSSFEESLDCFWSELDQFDPRSYVRDCLSMATAAASYLDAYRSLMPARPARRPKASS